ncbi:type IV secretion system protein VirB4 [Paraburkholderia sp. CNPSo 3272]|uniref:VirB4 family type IV secretion system protein n=1 Tax=Paraburkholderia sp. CNPSo 3272 TaxID=2940931 RepID=UPI0020B891A1|nr:type IV secretion system protein VirB4 [Paraburkholderia sp. CNPSo 3272]MCP3724630.1 type IV secretion system protein VirB4 [Paraburkholderia sp. CNPSo 3272]
MLKPGKRRALARRPIQEIAPWITMVTPDLVLDKDGSLLTSFTFEGVDADTPNTSDITAARNNLDNASKNFDHRVTAWWRLSHRRVKGAIDGEFASPLDTRLDAINRQNIGSGKFFRNSHSLSLAFTPETGFNKFFEKVGYHLKIGGKSMPLAAFEAISDQVLTRNAFAFDIDQLTADIRRFEGLLDAFRGGMGRLKMKRLELQNALAHLHQTANPSVPPRRVRYPVTMLDTHLTESFVTYGAEHLLFESAHGKRFAKIIAVKEWLGFQEAALDVLCDVDAELDICVMYRFLSASRAEAFIKSVRKFFKAAAINPWAILKQFFAKEEQKNDKGRETLADEAEDALKRLTVEGAQYGFANISVLVYGDTMEECDQATSDVVGRLSNAGFGLVLEKDNLGAAWASTLPGRWDQQKRLQFVETAAVSDVAPVRGVPEGPEVNEWLTQQFGRKTGATTILPTRHRTLQRVVLHHPGGRSHLLVVGPNGAGKTMLLNFLLSQMARHDARRIRFDKERSTRIPTVLSGGKFIDVTGRYEAATPINPLSLLSDERHYAYVATWVQMAIEDDAFKCTPTQEREIFERVAMLATGYAPEYWTLSFLTTLLSAELRERLRIWTKGEKNGNFFDHVDDAFALSDNLSIECGDLFQNNPEAALLFTDYAFYRISQWLDGTRFTVIEVEECGFFFLYPRFYARLELWAVTIRRLNGTLALATQSLKQLERVANFEVLKEQLQNIFYLANPDARSNMKLYGDVFGLSEGQIDMIVNAIPNRDYLWVTPTQTRMLQASFDKETLAALRADGRAQSVLDRHFTSGDENWADNYMREMLLSD